MNSDERLNRRVVRAFDAQREAETQAEEDRRRAIRVESKLTRFMRHFGVEPNKDVDEERRTVVWVSGGAVYASHPDVALAWLYDAMLDEKLTTADLFVAGVYRGRIVLDLKGE